MRPKRVKSGLDNHALQTCIWAGLLLCGVSFTSPSLADGSYDESVGASVSELDSKPASGHVGLPATEPAGKPASEPMAEPSWVLEKDSDGIQVYSREVAGSTLRAIRAQTQVKATLASAVAMLRDVSARPSWDTMCAQAYVHEQTSLNQELVYLHNDLPWPVTDRDMVLKRVWTFSPGGDYARVQETAVADVLPVDPKKVRVLVADGYWEISKVSEGITQLRTQVHLEPGGPLPSWLINSLSVQAPFEILQRIRGQLEQGAYAVSATSLSAASMVAASPAIKE